MNNSNFFSSYIKHQKTSASKVFGIVLMLILIVLILSSVFVYNFLQIRGLNKEHTRLQELTRASEFVKNRALINEVTNKLEFKQEFYARVSGISRNIEEIDVVTTPLLNSISGTLPEGISFEVLSLDAEQFQLMAVSNSRVEIAEFQYNLMRLGIFSEIHVANISAEGEGESRIFTFALHATMNGEELR